MPSPPWQPASVRSLNKCKQQRWGVFRRPSQGAEREGERSCRGCQTCAPVLVHSWSARDAAPLIRRACAQVRRQFQLAPNGAPMHPRPPTGTGGGTSRNGSVVVGVWRRLIPTFPTSPVALRSAGFPGDGGRLPGGQGMTSGTAGHTSKGTGTGSAWAASGG